MSDETTNTNNVVELKSAKKAAKKGEKCPLCAKPAADHYKPFCSKRCADLDLGKWLGDGYRIPTHEVPGFGDDYDGEE